MDDITPAARASGVIAANAAGAEAGFAAVVAFEAATAAGDGARPPEAATLGCVAYGEKEAGAAALLVEWLHKLYPPGDFNDKLT